jgi:hypothetical protein
MNKFIFSAVFSLSVLALAASGLCQQTDDLEFTLDAAAATTPLPKIFKPNLDLSGRGFYHEITWPQALASKDTLDLWQREIGFDGLYRLQFNLWDITQLSKDKDASDKIISNYESVIKSVSDAGGTVILNIFGTPAGMGKILDKKSAPVNISAFKELIKSKIKYLSCDKKYNIWYEAWNAPDLDDFFLGREQDYFNLYQAISESAKELEAQYKMHIPVGAPATSSWFCGVEGNTILSPENSLIYGLLKFCYRKHLKLDFITWHGFSSNPQAEKENTIYNKTAVGLVRDWLSYFNFDKNTPLVVDEWNYDRDANLLPERKEKSHISASYIPARIKNMYEAGIDNQIYFCLEDFQGNKEGVTRNVGVFCFSTYNPGSKVNAKVSFNVFKMLKELGPDMFSIKLNDEFAGAVATRSEDKIAILIYNYIDPEIVKNFISENIAALSPAETKFLLGIIRSDQLVKIVSQKEEVGSLPTTNRVKSLLKDAQKLNDSAKRFELDKRKVKINLKNLKGDYSYRLFTVDSTCSLNCEFKPAQEKEIIAQDPYSEELSLTPYSVNLIILKKKPEPPKPIEELKPQEQPKTVEPPKLTEQPKTVEPSKPQEPPKPVELALRQAPKDADAAGK